ncbi:MAG: hypothetical protein LBP78_07375 [Acidaminococcales bacterium]|jgi:hypothetical protein|nr:hypothetical protein [Acidaminococcales bacterium]
MLGVDYDIYDDVHFARWAGDTLIVCADEIVGVGNNKVTTVPKELAIEKLTWGAWVR